MTNPLLGANYENLDGEWINSDFRRLAELIQDYNAHFFLTWIPPRNRTEGDTHPFAILDETPGKAPYVIFHLSEEELKNPTAVLDRIFAGDFSKHDPIKLMEFRNRNAKLLELKKEEDTIGEQLEFADFLVRTNKHTVKHNGRTYR